VRICPRGVFAEDLRQTLKGCRLKDEAKLRNLKVANFSSASDETLIAMKVSAAKFRPTCSLADVLVSSAHPRGNMPKPYARKWTADE
jgi:hypothetical protein